MPLCIKYYGILFIMNSLLHLKEGAFAERLTDKAITKVIAQESKDDELKFLFLQLTLILKQHTLCAMAVLMRCGHGAWTI